jgi:hypothetical protein
MGTTEVGTMGAAATTVAIMAAVTDARLCNARERLLH